MRNSPNFNAKIIQIVKYCDTLVSNENGSTDEWIRVNFNKIEGFISFKDIKKGSCKQFTSEYRIGAVCNDGTSSAATGRGACSHHGGVRYWKTKTTTEYTIENN